MILSNKIIVYGLSVEDFSHAVQLSEHLKGEGAYTEVVRIDKLLKSEFDEKVVFDMYIDESVSEMLADKTPSVNMLYKVFESNNVGINFESVFVFNSEGEIVQVV